MRNDKSDYENLKKEGEVADFGEAKGEANAEHEKNLRGKNPSLRGDGEGVTHVVSQNMLMLFGSPPGLGVAADTDMAEQIAHIFNHRYEKQFFTLPIPQCFDVLSSKDANVVGGHPQNCGC